MSGAESKTDDLFSRDIENLRRPRRLRIALYVRSDRGEVSISGRSTQEQCGLRQMSIHKDEGTMAGK